MKDKELVAEIEARARDMHDRLSSHGYTYEDCLLVWNMLMREILNEDKPEETIYS
jgi:hypothetical protein